MSTAESEAGSPPHLGDDPQRLVGYRDNEEWNRLLAQSAALLERLDKIEDDELRANVFAALEAVDSVHREALHRLVRLFKEGVLEQVVTDPAIRTLMGMYDLLPPEKAACEKIWDFVDDPADDRASPPDIAPSRAEPPHWTPAPVSAPPADGEALICRMDEGQYVLAAAEGALYVFAATCPEHGALMQDGRVRDVSWQCPAGPGCVYDMRSGARLGGGPTLDCRPVKLDPAGRALIGFGMPFEPKQPAF